jgi:hypothetical protein
VSDKEFLEVSKILSEYGGTLETFDVSVQTGSDAHGRYFEIDLDSVH